ncbi:hypothetical protein, partial [Bacillus sp. JJ1474]|uniref:hypothetical protein n=1 Tax=Bacillus sp. JJ1474 TaxID=3122955 RepID=UPI002FFE7E73
VLFLPATGMILLHPSAQQNKISSPYSKQTEINETRYLVGRHSLIDKTEAEEIPPYERWNSIKDLKYTTSITVLCHPSSYEIDNQNLIKEIVDSFQKSKYLEQSEFPSHEPDLKLYFKKREDFIMAGRFYLKEAVIISPEGPIIKIDLETLQKIMEQADCK